MHDSIIPLGPQHSMVKEPTCLRLSLEGNYIQSAHIRLGYVHKGIEKSIEGMTIMQALYVIEKICGLCSFAHSSCYINAIEQMLRCKPPSHIRASRTIFAELSRIQSHLLWFGFFMHEMGYDTLFNYAMRERELILEILEKIVGNRIHYAVNKIGSLRYPVRETDIQFILKRIARLEKMLPFYVKMVKNNRVIKARTSGIGIIDRYMAKKFCLVGPVARASGIAVDIRKDKPYDAYNDVEFDIAVADSGDALARTLVRLEEIAQSIRIIRQLLKKLPKPQENKEIEIKEPQSIVSGIEHAQVEAPRGENFHLIKVKNGRIVRARIRPPTFANIPVLTELLIGKEVGDIPIILDSLDPCFACMERVVVKKEDKTEVLTEDEFKLKYC